MLVVITKFLITEVIKFENILELFYPYFLDPPPCKQENDTGNNNVFGCNWLTIVFYASYKFL